MTLNTEFNIRGTVATFALDSIVDRLDAPSGTFTPRINFYASSANLLAFCTLPSPAFGDATYSTSTQLAESALLTTATGSATATGKAIYYTVTAKGTSPDLVIFGGPVVKSGDTVPCGGAMVLPTNDLVSGVTVEVSSYKLQFNANTVTLI